MAIWKELNPDTGEYEPIPGAATSTGSAGSTGSGENTSVALPNMKGKTLIAMGDSYTYGMAAVLKTMAAEFNMTVDNRGVVSSTICGDYDAGTDKGTGYKQMWKRTAELCQDYEGAGTTGNVGAIMFMGGANDGFGAETWIGTGIHDTDTKHIYGAMHSLLNDFRKTFDNVPIFVILQPSSYNRTVESITDEDTAKAMGFDSLESLQALDDYQFSNYAMFKKEKAVKEVAEYYGCHIIDCCFDFPSVMSASDRAKYWSAADKLHLTGAANELICARLKARMADVLGGA